MSCNALYIHVPFCLSKCPYCDFYSVNYSDQAAEEYTRAIYRALTNLPMSVDPLQTVYFGGGTPTLLGGMRIGAILHAAARHTLLPDAEITVECNPNTITRDLLQEFRIAGVNRISLGMQSADDHLLKTLGRSHSTQQVAQAIDMCHRAGFENISVDLMIGLPGQGEEEIIRAVRFCRAHGVSHVSAYLLKIEPGTPFAENGIAKFCPDEDTQADLYLFAVRSLESHGFNQYEISNFCRKGMISRHNYHYWAAGEYLGIGPSAHSFFKGRRFHFPRDLESFLSAKDAWALTIDDGPGGGREEYIMLRLRLSEGISWTEGEALYPGIREDLEEGAAILNGTGLVNCDETGIRLTAKGMLVSNSVIAMLMPDGKLEDLGNH